LIRQQKQSYLAGCVCNLLPGLRGRDSATLSVKLPRDLH